MRWLAGASRALRQVQLRAGLQAEHQRAFAQKAVAELKWDDALDALATQVTSEEGKRELASLKSTFYDIKAKYAALTKDAEPINWEAYSKEIDPKLVAMFKQAYDSTPLPKYPGKEAEEAAALFDGIAKQADTMVADSKRRIDEINAELALIKKELAQVGEMTVDEALADDPKLAAQIDAEISEGKWY